MYSLDMLATVATETLKCLSPGADDSKKSLKRQELITCKELKSLPAKVLIEKFTELTADEMRRKYYYKCLFLPGNCDIVFESFGNEKRALALMRVHLVKHLNALEEGDCMKVPARANSSTKRKASVSSVRKPKNVKVKVKPEGEDIVSLRTTERAKQKNRQDPETFDRVMKVLGEENGAVLDVVNSYGQSKGISKRKKKKFDVAEDRENSNSVIPSTPFEEFTDVEYDDLQILKYTPFQWTKTAESKGIFRSQKAIQEAILEDHNYTSDIGYTCEAPPFTFVKIPPREVLDPEYIIPTPKFPYIYDPTHFETVEVEVLTSDCKPVKKMRKYNVDTVANLFIVRQKPESPGTTNSPDLFHQIGSDESNPFTLESDNCCRLDHKSESAGTENFGSFQCEKEWALDLISKLNQKKKKAILNESLTCLICKDSKTFTAVATLISHYRSHAGIKPYACELCSRTFTRQHSLNYHNLIHRNVSRFRCEVCGRAFRHPSHFKEHLRRHTGESPFCCTECELHFKTRNTFKRHLRIRHGKFPASYREGMLTWLP